MRVDRCIMSVTPPGGNYGDSIEKEVVMRIC